MYMPPLHALYWQRPEENIKTPETGYRGSLGSGNQTRVVYRIIRYSQLLSHLYQPHIWILGSNVVISQYALVLKKEALQNK